LHHTFSGFYDAWDDVSTKQDKAKERKNAGLTTTEDDFLSSRRPILPSSKLRISCIQSLVGLRRTSTLASLLRSISSASLTTSAELAGVMMALKIWKVSFGTD
jgi:hypothetical protein